MYVCTSRHNADLWMTADRKYAESRCLSRSPQWQFHLTTALSPRWKETICTKRITWYITQSQQQSLDAGLVLAWVKVTPRSTTSSRAPASYNESRDPLCTQSADDDSWFTWRQHWHGSTVCSASISWPWPSYQPVCRLYNRSVGGLAVCIIVVLVTARWRVASGRRVMVNKLTWR